MDLSMLSLLTVTCGAATTVLIALLIYRAVLSTKEEDRLFLNREAKSHDEEEQLKLQSRLSTIGRYAMIFGAVAVVLMLTIAGIYTYQQLTRPPIA